jgi:hypothetical protein
LADWPPATGPPAGRQPTECTPRDKPPDLARRGEIATKTQKLRPALPCEPLLNHVLPLAHFGATSDVCDGGVVRTDHHNAGERSGGTAACLFCCFLPGGLLHKQGPRRARLRAAPLPHPHNALLATSCCCAPAGGPRSKKGPRSSPTTPSACLCPLRGGLGGSWSQFC